MTTPDDGARWKFGSPDGSTLVRHVRADVWCREQTSGPERLAIGPSTGAVELLLDLAGALTGSFRVLYVLLVPHVGGKAGRYESPPGLARGDVEAFFRRFQGFLEGDGCHHVWVATPETDGLLVYDRHEIVYAYGPLDHYEATLRRRGFRPAPIDVPVPHAHRYHAEFDRDATSLLAYWPWTWSPLR